MASSDELAKRCHLNSCDGTSLAWEASLTHIPIQEQLDGKAVDWMEEVSDEQYRR